MALPGARALDRALARLEADSTDSNTVKAAGELVRFTARPKSPSRRVGRTGRVLARRGQSVIRFGSPATPWAVPSHFGHGSPGDPRPQGGWMPAVPFLYEARDEREEEVIDLFLRRTIDVARREGLL